MSSKSNIYTKSFRFEMKIKPERVDFGVGSFSFHSDFFYLNRQLGRSVIAREMINIESSHSRGPMGRKQRTIQNKFYRSFKCSKN